MVDGVRASSSDDFAAQACALATALETLLLEGEVVEASAVAQVLAWFLSECAPGASTPLVVSALLG